MYNHIRAKDIPLETMDLEENIVAFAWEPTGHRFAVIHEVSANNNAVTFYDVKKKKIELISEFISFS